MGNCLICGKPIHYDAYHQAWVHSDPKHYGGNHAAEARFWSA